MPQISASNQPHPPGEAARIVPVCVANDDVEPLIVDTPGGRFQAQFVPDLPVSSLGALVFFAQFLATSGGFEALVADTPLSYESNRAHAPRDVLGTLLLGILSGHYRYAHLAALRCDALAPSLLGLAAIVSEDCVRRALRRISAEAGQDWLRRHLDQSCHEFLDSKWILDIDVTIKPIYGHQEGVSDKKGHV